MLASNAPTKVSVPFANAGTKNAIPVPSQVGITPGAASFTDGFPPLTFTPKASGGIPPFGADFNGVLNFLSASVRWACAGGSYSYDSAFSTAITGYPAGAQIQRVDGTGFWLNTVDNNATNPEAGGAGWVPVNNYGITAIAGLSNVNVTLTALQYARPAITLAGVLTGNVQIIFPVTLQEWLVINNTTGAFTLTCTTSGGTGGVVAQSGGQQTFWGDGTNLQPLAGNGALPLKVGAATLNSQAVNLGQFPNSLAANGYTTLPNGMIMQWGQTTSITSGGSGSTSFPVPFPTACYAVQLTYVNGSGIPTGGNPCMVSSVSATAFTTNNGGASTSQYYFQAIGK